MENEQLTWEDLRVLLAVARGASFLAAGRELGLSTSTVARRITILEGHIGAQLVRRSASGTSLEPQARPLVDLAERIEAELAVTARDVRARPETFAGTVRISLGEGFLRFGARVAAAFRRVHPETLVELIVDQRVADLPKREADLALRTIKSTSATVVTRKLGELRYGLFATDEYLRRHKRVSRESFAMHDFVAYEGFLAKQPEVRWLRDRGATKFPFRASNTDGLLEGAAASQGIAALPILLAETVPTLRAVDIGEAPPSKPVFLAMHRDMRRVPRVRAFAEAIVRETAHVFSSK